MRILAAAFVVFLQVAIAAGQKSPASNLDGRFGPYGGISTPADAKAMRAAGFDLVLPSNFSAALRSALRDDGITYIDLELSYFVSQRCAAQVAEHRANKEPAVCNLSDADREELTETITKHLNEVKGDPGIAGFWILDDYPGGDIRIMLQTVHDLVHQVGAAVGKSWPTICGLGGNLDVRESPHERFAPQHERIGRAAINVTPSACDYVSPYLYGERRRPDAHLVDWSLSNEILHVRDVLRANGFRSSVPLVPIIQAFGNCERYHGSGVNCHVTPRPQDIVAEAKAWTNAGAAAMLFFTWQSRDSDENYAADPAIRTGVQEAAKYFRSHHH